MHRPLRLIPPQTCTLSGCFALKELCRPQGSYNVLCSQGRHYLETTTRIIVYKYIQVLVPGLVQPKQSQVSKLLPFYCEEGIS